jgi:hypothetical protein
MIADDELPMDYHNVTAPGDATLRRGAVPWRERPERMRAWYEPVSGCLVLPNGDTVYMPRQDWHSVLTYCAGLLPPLRPDIVMRVGGTQASDTPKRDELLAPTVDGWAVDLRIDEDGALHKTHATYTREGQRIELRSTAEWFGECRNASVCRQAWIALENLLRASFDSQVRLLSTPGRMGADLLERSLPFGHAYPVLPHDTRQHLSNVFTQGRIELLTAGRDDLPALHCLDGRWMYASCVSNLPAGQPRYDRSSAYAPYVPGFYSAMIRPPLGWGHIGLLPRYLGRSEDGGRQWAYPSSAREPFTGWFTSAEVAVAIENGWTVRIHERILWPERGSDPCKAWATKLKQIRAGLETAAAEGDQVAAVLTGAVRHLLIDTIGYLARSQSWQQGYARVDDPRLVELIPEGATITDYGTHGYIVWETYQTPAEPRFLHPEWAITVWGRARARLANAALRLPRESLVALRSDAIWLDHDPRWPDDGKPGTFRAKGAGLPGPVPAPQTEDAMRRLMAMQKAQG